MYQSDATGQNTLYVNDLLVRIFKLMLVAIAAFVILKAAGIILIPWLHTIIIAGTVIIACAVPIACRGFSMDVNTVRNVNIYCMAVICILGYSYLNMGIIMLLVIPIGFACMYFDMKLISRTIGLSVLGIAIGELLRAGSNWSFDYAAQNGNIRLILYFFQFGAAAALITAISKRALSILSSTHSHYENINNIFSNIQVSSQSLEAAEQTLLNGVNSLNVNNEEDASSSNTVVKGIISNINKSMENAREIMKYTQTMLKGKVKDLKTEEAARIEEYSRSSREIILKLDKYTEKIKEDLNLISVMIDESRLLSVNAAAEAENASSGGRGSAIIAMKVEKLADESVESATHIQELLNNVVNDAENTIKSVADAYEEMFKSLELINRTVETLIKWLMYKNMK
ncbi:MAG TPA: methyl-accepting chemotaxis protein [Bacillota bacterium]|nr:methyl-accepting chemotaxis protein [Bacillota bacterium]